MAFKSLEQFVRELERAGELIRIKEYVSPNLQITEIADRFVKTNGPALLFENTGTDFPLLINALASDKRICLALGISKLEDVEAEMSTLFGEFTSPRKGWISKLKLLPSLKNVASWFPVVSKRRGECQEIILDPPDLSRLPVLTCWPFDGGPFITLPCVHTKDPETGMRNLGMYRMQVFGKQLTGMHWHLHKGSASHYRKYAASGKRMPVTVTLGGDPAYTYSATAPLPENVDEYLLAGFLRKKKVEMVKCLTNELEVPSDVDFVIEGYVDPAEEPILEGPFGDHTGFYSLADFYPRFHVTCITHRKNAVYPATIVGIPPQEDGWIGKATEKVFLMPIRLTLAPEIVDMHMPVEGVFHNITLVKIEKKYQGQALKIINALWGAGQMMFNKIMVVLDQSVDLRNYQEVLQKISQHADPVTDVHFMRGPVDVLDHASSRFAFGSKMGIDATAKDHGERSGQFTNSSEMPFLIYPVSKNHPGQVREMANNLLISGDLKKISYLVFVDANVDVNDLSQVVWLVANNIDPVRDCFYPVDETGKRFPVLCLDGTFKNYNLDGFSRDWPNIIIMDSETIQFIDDLWINLKIGQFIPSPSLRYKCLVNNPGAVAFKAE